MEVRNFLRVEEKVRRCPTGTAAPNPPPPQTPNPNRTRPHSKWKDYQDVEMKWIHHHNSDLVILDDSGNENERIDLNGYTEAKLERLLQSKGVKKRM